MKQLSALALLLGLCVPAQGFEPPGNSIRLISASEPPPATPAVRLPTVPPVPPPVPTPTTPTVLGIDQLYVIDSDVSCIVLASPPGLLKMTTESGPLKVRGKFVDGLGIETRNYKGKFLYVVESAGQAGKVELFIIPSGAAAPTDIIRRCLDVAGSAPVPPPGPPVPPTPPTPPSPIPGDGFRVLMVFNQAEAAKLTPGQSAAIYGAATRSYLNAKCAVGADGKTKEFRIWPHDGDPANESQLWQDAYKRPHPELPWIVIANGKGGYEGKMPGSLEEITKLLKQFGGE